MLRTLSVTAPAITGNDSEPSSVIDRRSAVNSGESKTCCAQLFDSMEPSIYSRPSIHCDTSCLRSLQEIRAPRQMRLHRRRAALQATNDRTADTDIDSAILRIVNRCSELPRTCGGTTEAS